ncbi:MAG: sarcosine oxidase, alpha subunit family [Tardiphaga sp.]|nr:sarcosine oxidase, alpha subunit family [Tardiphaga sp.]
MSGVIVPLLLLVLDVSGHQRAQRLDQHHGFFQRTNRGLHRMGIGSAVRRAGTAAGFPGNDRPGTMQASALHTYLHRFAVSAGQRVAIFTTSNDGWRSAFDLSQAGVAVAAGYRRLKSVTVIDCSGGTHAIAADTLGVSGGWTPSVGIATHLGGKADWAEAKSAFLCNEVPKGMQIVGAAAARWRRRNYCSVGSAGMIASGASGRPGSLGRCEAIAFAGCNWPIHSIIACCGFGRPRK